MNKIDKLLKELCPNGVEYKSLWEVTAWDKHFNAVNKYSYVKIYFKNNAQYKKPIFTSKNKVIATVDKAGRIKAQKKGTVIIVTKWYGKKYKRKLIVK
jgi:hypothetical protein